MSSFNDAIRGLILLESGFFGANFSGYIPDAFGLKGCNRSIRGAERILGLQRFRCCV
jgi:hypothetical protein